MKARVILCLLAGIMLFTLPVFAQVGLKTGTIYGKVQDDKGAALPGVNITLESDVIPAQTAQSGASGGFRFANLPPGTYSVNFSIEGFTQVSQEDVRVSVGSNTQLDITLKASLSEEFTVIGETPIVDTKKQGVQATYNREFLEDVPSARDPWVIIDQTSGIDTDRYNVAGSESGQQSNFVARGGTDDNNVWNYDGVNASDPAALGASPGYYDFDAFEELSISTGGNDASVGTSGVVVNIVTKRAGNKWEANGSYYIVNDSLQASNTPDELKSIGASSNRIDDVKDYGFDIGGPIIADKLFAWGAYRKNDISLLTVNNVTDKTNLESINFKTNFNWNSANESQFGYFNGGGKTKSGRPQFNTVVQAPETLWEQGGPDMLEGIWTGQHTWIPNDHTIVTGRYGYVGLGFSLVSRGGTDVPMILLGEIPHYESTWATYNPINRPAHDWVVDANYYKENLMGGDHEFKFGFEYKTAKVNSGSFYGNGLYIVDSAQTVPGGALTYGYLYVLHNNLGNIKAPRTSFYATDTYRKDRLTLNLGLRFDSQTGSNDPGTAIGGFGEFADVLLPVNFEGSDPGITFNDISPRLGATYDITGDGKTVVRGSYARYYDGFNGQMIIYSNPTFLFSGAYATYTNLNGDREVSRDEITSPFGYFGGAAAGEFDLDAFMAGKLYADDLENSGADEFMAGFERQLAQDISLSLTYTYRSYFNPIQIGDPFGVTAADYVQGPDFIRDNILGHFQVPTYTFNGSHDGTQIVHNIRDYKQSYNGLDINLRKRMSNNFMLSASMILQRQKAEYDGGDSALYVLSDGGASPGNPFPGNPGNVTFADGEPYSYAPGGSGRSSVYPYSEWHFKFSGVYQFPWDISVGAFGRYQQGYPYVLWGRNTDAGLFSVMGTSSSRFLVEPFGSRRFDNIFMLDLQVEKAFEMGQYGRLNLSANFFNVTNTNTVIRRNADLTSTTFNSIVEVISPMAVRLGVRYSF